MIFYLLNFEDIVSEIIEKVGGQFSSFCVRIYGKTSINDLSEKQPTSLERPNHEPPIATTTNIVHLEPPRSNHLLFPTSDQFLSPILLKTNTFAPLQATKDHTY